MQVLLAIGRVDVLHCAVMGNLPSERMHTADGRTAKNPSNLFQRMKSAANNKLPGQFLLENFITEDEERELIDYIDTCEPPWHLSTFNGPHGYTDLFDLCLLGLKSLSLA